MEIENGDVLDMFQSANKDFERIMKLKDQRKTLSDFNEVNYYIVYFWKDDVLAYIGRNTSQDPIQYIIDRMNKKGYTHYTLQMLDCNSSDQVGNYVADEIFDLKPLDNQSIPKNTKYISSHIAKEKYRIDRVEFKKIHKEHNGKSLGKALYLEKKIFDDIYCREPYHQKMPKIGDDVVLMKYDDYLSMEHILHGGGKQEYSSGKDEDGNKFEMIKTVIVGDDEVCKIYRRYLKSSYVVTQLLNQTEFIAESEIHGEVRLT